MRPITKRSEIVFVTISKLNPRAALVAPSMPQQKCIVPRLVCIEEIHHTSASTEHARPRAGEISDVLGNSPLSLFHDATTRAP